MIISLYPKPTKCYGDTVIRRAEKVDSITEKVLGRAKRPRSSGLFTLLFGYFTEKMYLCTQLLHQEWHKCPPTGLRRFALRRTIFK